MWGVMVVVLIGISFVIGFLVLILIFFFLGYVIWYVYVDFFES